MRNLPWTGPYDSLGASLSWTQSEHAVANTGRVTDRRYRVPFRIRHGWRASFLRHVRHEQQYRDHRHDRGPRLREPAFLAARRRARRGWLPCDVSLRDAWRD